MGLAIITATTTDPAPFFACVAIAAGAVAIAILSTTTLLRRARPKPQFQDDADYAKARAIEATEAEIEKLRAILAGPRRDPANGQFIAKGPVRVRLANAEQRLSALTQS